jgi:hypothetical protein
MSGYYWCLSHSEVEHGPGCANMKRLGPYDTPEQAAQAPERTRARTEQQDALDEADDDWGSAKH